jgi:hypothetical protein
LSLQTSEWYFAYDISFSSLTSKTLSKKKNKADVSNLDYILFAKRK